MFIIMIFSISLILFGVFFLIMFLLSDLTPFLKEKMSPFECGIENFKKIRVPFSMQFFFLGIIFILFDMEIIFLIHFMYYLNNYFFYYYLIYIIIFFLFLFVTLLIEWKWDSLNWIF